MESKIEKFDKHKEYRFEAELTTDIMAKIEEIIDYLNSQDQEEEITRSKEDMERTDYTGYPYSKEFQSTTQGQEEEKFTEEEQRVLRFALKINREGIHTVWDEDIFNTIWRKVGGISKLKSNK